MLQRFTPHRVCHLHPLRHYANQLSEKSESFFVARILFSFFLMRSVRFALFAHFGSAAIAAVAFVRAASADKKIIAAFRIGAAMVFARIEQQLI